MIRRRQTIDDLLACEAVNDGTERSGERVGKRGANDARSR